MTLAVYTHPDCLEHHEGPGHPESPARLHVILDALKTCDFADKLEIIDAPSAEDDLLLLAHSQGHLDHIRESLPVSGYAHLDADTAMSPDSFRAARRAAGAGCAAIEAIIAGKYKTAFCAVRPPGHHATRNRAMGFCLFNNIAIAALFALQRHNVSGIAIVDFDVHHGNGTQDIIEPEKRILYISTHQSPFYPGTGYSQENRPNHILNLPLPQGTDGKAYRKVFVESVMPALEQFAPELLLVSAGFDAHRDDPLAGLQLTEDDYRWIGQQLITIANTYCGGKVISFLEGGYNLDVLGSSVMAYLSTHT
jgi:acetoin utilization deacetylase AcuC-like enzyme